MNGFDAHQVVMTITVREKGKTLEENGGLVLTADEWLVPRIPAMKEVVDFDIRYAQKLYGPMISGASAQDMAAAAALYPMMAPAIAKMRAEGVKMDGTPVMTVLTFDAVQSAEQAAAEQKESKPSASGGLGGIAGGLMRRATQKKSAESRSKSERAHEGDVEHDGNPEGRHRRGGRGRRRASGVQREQVGARARGAGGAVYPA